MTYVKPGQEGWTQYAYNVASGTTPSKVWIYHKPNGGGTALATEEIHIDPFGRVSVERRTIVRANGTTYTYTVDPQNQLRPNKIDTKVTSTGAVVWSSGVYSYDGAGNVVKMGSSYFLHDAVSRIDSGTLYTGHGGGATGPEPFDHTYDGFGNLQSMTSNGVLRNTPTSSGTNRLTGSVGYDAAGALTAWNGASYSYDEAGMMWRMVSGTEDWLYIYTADDERIWSYKPAANLSRWTLRGLDQKVLREYQNLGGTWTVQRDYVYRGGDALPAETPTGVNHLHPDHLGTVRAVTNSTGTRIAYHAYFPFGEEATSPTQDTERMKYTGHERDLANSASAADDLDYMHARFYNPLTARFLSVDPKDRYWAMNAPQRWNRYTYALGGPLKFVDPDGEETKLVVGGHTESNVFGHIAIAIDDKVYSYGTSYVNDSGDWGVSLDAYLTAQEDKRSTTLLTLDLSPEEEKKLATILRANDPRQQPYSVLSNSCVTACERALESAGVLPNNPGPERTDSAGNQLQAGAPRSSTPGGLAGQVQGSGLVTSSSTHGQQQVSKLRALWNTAREAIERLGK